MCAGCGAECTWNGTELVDPEDGAPHRLTCSRLQRGRRWLGQRMEHCEKCGRETRHQVVRDRRGELLRCLGCFRARSVVHHGRDGAGLRGRG